MPDTKAKSNINRQKSKLASLLYIGGNLYLFGRVFLGGAALPHKHNFMALAQLAWMPVAQHLIHSEHFHF